MATTEPVSDITDTTTIKSTVRERADIPRAANILGIDADGYVHIHSPRRAWVWILSVDPDTPVASVVRQQADVAKGADPTRDEPPIWQYIAHVRRERGWAELRYSRGSPFAAIADTLADAAEADE